jgi:hypothetical protein
MLLAALALIQPSLPSFSSSLIKDWYDIFFFNQLRDLATRFPRTLRLAKQIIP